MTLSSEPSAVSRKHGNRVSIKIFVLTLSAMLFALWASVQAQQPKKVPRIGYLSAFDPARESGRAEVIRSALRELGYIEGENIAFEYRYAKGKQGQFHELASELVTLDVDVIVVFGGDILVKAARSATKTIPIVMTGGDSIRSRLGWFKAWRVPAETSRALPTFLGSSAESGWS